jgi:hypothetical protein
MIVKALRAKFKTLPGGWETLMPMVKVHDD